MLEKVISGAQTGADLGGLLAARLFGIKTGGWMPKGFRNLNGNHPEYAELFGITEHMDSGYKARTWANAGDSDATLRIACNFSTAGEICTLNGIRHHNKPWFDVEINQDKPIVHAAKIHEFVRFLEKYEVKTLNVAGNSHKTWKGMQSVTVQFLSGTFYMLGFDRRSLDSRYWNLAERGW